MGRPFRFSSRIKTDQKTNKQTTTNPQHHTNGKGYQTCIQEHAWKLYYLQYLPQRRVDLWVFRGGTEDRQRQTNQQRQKQGAIPGHRACRREFPASRRYTHRHPCPRYTSPRSGSCCMYTYTPDQMSPECTLEQANSAWDGVVNGTVILLPNSVTTTTKVKATNDPCLPAQKLFHQEGGKKKEDTGLKKKKDRKKGRKLRQVKK